MKRVLTLATLLLLASMGIAASAQQKPSGGVTVTPALQELELAEGRDSLQSSFTVQNNSDKKVVYEISTVDMGALDETGGLVFSGLPQDFQKKYGLAGWIQLPQTSIEIEPGKVGTVKFAIPNESSLSPGGHYGAIIIKQSGEQAASQDQIAISPQAASLIFLLKRGGEAYDLKLDEFTSNRSIWQLPSEVNLLFKNSGNVHVVPRGIITLKSSSGDVLAKTIINRQSAYILPERSRSLFAGFEQLPGIVWPGRYTLEVQYRYDGQEEFTTISKTFYSANLRVLLLLLSTLIILLLLTYRFRRAIIKFVRSVRKFLSKQLKIIRRKL